MYIAAVVLALCATQQAFGAIGCRTRTQSRPNPIAAQYPNDTTGTLNGTIAILPITLSLARSIIPAEYPILEKAYRELLPSFPPGMYPAMLQANLDHDVGSGTDVNIPDFSRAGISFPFVDRLNNGYTSMVYGDTILISATNPVGIAGASAYGNRVTPGSFDPPCDGYAFINGSQKGATYFNVYATPESKASLKIGTVFRPLKGREPNPYPLRFWRNVTNQPQFSANKLFCDNFIRLFNSSNTLPPYTPTPVKGEVSAVKPFFAQTTVFKDVFGLRLDNAFIERNFMSCESLKGYHGTGSGD